jgi:uncharacterized protein
MTKRHHIPIRTCIACRQTDEKRDLLRVVRQPDGSVLYDPKGKMSGRGAYVCARVPCIEQARKRKGLERSLKVTGIPETLFTELMQHATSEPETIAPESAEKQVSGNSSARE